MKKSGNLFILMATLLFSISGLCIKMVPWNPMAINGGRCMISICILFLYFRITKRKLVLSKGVFIGAFSVCATTVLFSFATKLTTAANAILIQYVAPVFLILGMWIFFKERPRRLDVITCVLVFSGIACFFLDSLGAGNSLGNFLALCSGMTYAGMFSMNKMPGGDSFSATFLGHIAGALIGAPFLVMEKDFSLTPIFFVVLLGVFQMALAFICLCKGLEKTAPVTASLINGLEPILNPLWVAIVLKEFISPMSALGGAIVLGAVTAYNVLLVKRRPVAEDLKAIEALQRNALLEEEAALLPETTNKK